MYYFLLIIGYYVAYLVLKWNTESKNKEYLDKLTDNYY